MGWLVFALNFLIWLVISRILYRNWKIATKTRINHYGNEVSDGPVFRYSTNAAIVAAVAAVLWPFVVLIALVRMEVPKLPKRYFKKPDYDRIDNLETELELGDKNVH